MADYADRVLTVIEADTSGHDPKIRTSAQVVDRAATQIERSATKMETAVRSSSTAMVRGFDQAGQRSRLLGYQISDVGTQLAMGSNPFLIIAQQAPQVANALDGASGAVGRFATFLSGPLGAALLAVGSVFAIMISRIGESEEKLTKQEQAARLLQRALNGEADAIREVNQALREQAQESENAIQTDQLRARVSLENARHAFEEARAIRERLKAKLEEALADQQAAEFAGRTGAEGGDAGRIAAERAQQRAAELRRQIAEQERIIAQTGGAVINSAIPIFQREVEASMDGAARATLNYERALERLRQQLARGLAPADYQRQLRAITKARDDAIEAAREAERAARRGVDADNTVFRLPAQGRVTGRFGENRGNRAHAGLDIAVPVGTRVGAAAAGTVIETGNAPGFGNYVLIDHGRGTTSRVAHLSRIVATRGQQVSQGDVLGLSGGARGSPGAGNSRGPHVHYEVRRNGRPVDPRAGRFPADSIGAQDRAEAIAAQIAREAEQRARNEASFQAELAQLGEELLQTRRRGVESAEERFRLEAAELEAARKRRNASYEEAERRGQLTAAQRGQLAEKNDEIYLQLQINAQLREWQRLDEQRYQIAVADLRDAQSIEQARGQFARTIAQRRESELRLLDYAHEEELRAIERARLQEGINDAERQRLDRAEATANERYSLGHRAVEQRNMSPLQQFLDRAPSSAEELDEALEGVAANGLQAVNDGLAEAIGNFIDLGGTAGRIVSQMIADLARLLIYKNITAPLANSLGNLFGGGGLGSAATAGARAGGLGGLPGFASGGTFMVGGNGGIDRNVLSINGQPRARVSADERIAVIPQGRTLTGFSGRAAMAPGGTGLAKIQLMLSEDLTAKIVSVSGPVAVEIVRTAAPQIISAAKADTLRSASRPRLNRG